MLNRRNYIVSVLILFIFTLSFSSDVLAQANTLQVSGLKDKVTVTRDERGIPYIEATNDADLNFAQGYITASDRLWQMDVLRRTTRGEMAEIFGKVVLEEDKRRRIYGFAKMSEEMAMKLPEPSKSLLDAYCKGVNAYIETLDKKTLPLEFRVLKYKPRPWTPADAVVIGLLMAESLSTSWQNDVFRGALADLPEATRNALMPEYSALDTPVVGTDKVKAKAAKGGATKAAIAPISRDLLQIAALDEDLKQRSLERVGLYAEGLAASNNWVVSGKRTVSGKPLLANDPHLAISVPSIWYLVHLSAPGIRAAGVSIAGINGVIIGHNDRIAWGMTNLGPDVQDLYKEKFDPANPNKYLTPQGWKDAEIRKEEIKVRKTATGTETETVNLDVTITRHGPIIIDKNGERLALKWTVLNSNLESVSMFHKLNRAKNWKDFTEALRTYAGATQNFIYADQDGHIGYYGAGVIPIRKSGDGSVPYDGSKDDGEWIGMIPFDKLPHVYDPPSGMIVTANARIVGKDYPYFLTHGWSAPYRQKRITDLLSAKSKVTIEDFRAIQGDVFAIGGKTFADGVVKAFGNNVSDENLKASLKLMAEWDGKVLPDSKAALLVHEMRDIFGNKIAVSVMGEERARQYRTPLRNTMMDNVMSGWAKEWLPTEYANWKDFLKACHDEARASISKKLGTDESKWTFGNAVQVKFNHPLSAAPMIGGQFKIDPIPQRGNGYAGGLGPTPNVGPGVSMRLIADPSNWDRSQHGITLGESGDPKSAHYKDQLNDWINATPQVFPFSKEAVSQAAKTTMVMMPR